MLAYGTAIGLSGGFTGAAKIQQTQAKLQRIDSALQSYNTLAGRYPTEAQGLEALVKKPTIPPVPKRYKPYFDTLPKDAWDQDFIYKRQGSVHKSRPEVISLGEDGEVGGDDDLSSQDTE